MSIYPWCFDCLLICMSLWLIVSLLYFTRCFIILIHLLALVFQHTVFLKQIWQLSYIIIFCWTSNPRLDLQVLYLHTHLNCLRLFIGVASYLNGCYGNIHILFFPFDYDSKRCCNKTVSENAPKFSVMDFCSHGIFHNSC